MTTHPSGLAPGTVHIWHIDLKISPERASSCRSSLSNDECQRADRFHFERDTRRFVAAHAAMRTILAAYLGQDPKDVLLVSSHNGKPELGAGLSLSGLKFNLSHSGNFALLGVTLDSRIGVDIEFIKPEYSGDEIATRFFSAAEVRALGALVPEERLHAFFRCWTRKEAYIKALGDGLSHPLDCFDVALASGEPAQLLRVEGLPEELLRWKMYDLPFFSQYAAALVVEGREHQLVQRRWDWNTFC